jgi:acetyl esterase/lipase
MKRINKILLIIVILFINSFSYAQNEVIDIWNGNVPGAIQNDSVKENIFYLKNGAPRIRNVTDPTLTVFKPSGSKANGTAIIICPGGAYSHLAYDPEGTDVAKLLNKYGVTAFVLKYRLPDDRIMKDKSIGPLQDVQESVRIVRRNAKDWNINPNQIGIIGFSAGGHVAASASTLYNDKVYDSDTTGARPDFSILIYPVISMNAEITHKGSRDNLLGNNPDEKLIEHFSTELQVNKNTPPAFLVCAEDDPAVPIENSIQYFLALKKYNIPAELHIYEKGGHGFGLAKNGGTESHWPDACIYWLKENGLL